MARLLPGTGLRVRRGRRRDLPQVQAVLRTPPGDRRERFWRRVVADLGSDVYVAEDPEGQIVGLVFAQGMRQTAVGLAIGLVAAFGLTRVLKAILVSTSASDPNTYILASVVLVLAAACGCVVPALRATRVDPTTALRFE